MDNIKSFPEITVITPHYESKALFRSVDSVLMQSYPNVQYIIVVDGDRGYDPKIIKEYLCSHADKNVHWSVIALKQNMGTVKALNTALAETKGDFVFNLADDDIFVSPDVLSGWTAHMIENHSAICTAKRQVITGDGTGVAQIRPDSWEIKKIRTLTPQKLFDDLAVTNYVFGAATAQSRNSFEIYGFYDESYRLTEDYPRVMKLLRSGVRLDFFPEEVVCCQSNGVSSPGKILNLMEENERIFRREILPFCSKYWRVRLLHWGWKIKTVRYGRFLSKISCTTKWYSRLALYLIYPENIIRQMKNSRGVQNGSTESTNKRR